MVEEREEGYMCTLLCTESGRNVRASVRNVVPLLVTVTSARARASRAQYRRCIILCACRAHGHAAT